MVTRWEQNTLVEGRKHKTQTLRFVSRLLQRGCNVKMESAEVNTRSNFRFPPADKSPPVFNRDVYFSSSNEKALECATLCRGRPDGRFPVDQGLLLVAMHCNVGPNRPSQRLLVIVHAEYRSRDGLNEQRATSGGVEIVGIQVKLLAGKMKFSPLDECRAAEQGNRRHLNLSERTVKFHVSIAPREVPRARSAWSLSRGFPAKPLAPSKAQPFTRDNAPRFPFACRLKKLSQWRGGLTVFPCQTQLCLISGFLALSIR